MRGNAITLADGKSYTLAPLVLGRLEDLEPKIASGTVTTTDMIDAIHASLVRNYPAVTREAVRMDLLDVANIKAAFEATVTASGMEARETPGEAKRGRSTGKG